MTPVPSTDDFRAAVLAGLSRRRRAIPCRWLYDEIGSALFEVICTLPEYYLTRAETALLERVGPDLAELAGPGRVVVDLGAGSMSKTRLLLSALTRPAALVPVDIARRPLLTHARRLAEEFPALTVEPLNADFTRPLTLPPTVSGPVLGFFPGSTIGNLGRCEAMRLLRGLRRLGGPLLVGVDLVKDPAVLEAAYDDRAGVTAAFTGNLLARLVRELDAEIDRRAFTHRARWNPRRSRIEIHLVCRRATELRVAGRRFAFGRGSAIHVEDCHKYSPEAFRRLATRAGWTPVASWIDHGYSLHLLAPSGTSPL
jgi:dimethylhistidine N-methyltransferase